MKNLTRWLLLFLLSYGASYAALAQDKALALIMQQKDDTAKVNQLQKYANALLDKDNQQAVELFKIIITKSKQLNYTKGLAVAHRKLGYVKGQEGDYQIAIDNYRISIYNYGKLGQVDGQVVCYNNMGTNFWQLGIIDSAMFYYIKGIKELEKPVVKSETPAARKERLSGLSLKYDNIGILYGNLENFKKAHYYGSKALNLARQAEDTTRWVNSLVTLSHAYEVNENYKEMAAFSREAVKLALSKQMIIPLAKSYHMLSVAYLGLNKADSAIFAAKRCGQLAEKSDAQLYLSSLLDLAGGYHQKKKYAEEASILELALNKYGIAGSIGAGEDIYKMLAKSKHALGDNAAAYAYLEKSRIYQDSIYKEQSQSAVAELDVKYQTAQKEKALSQKQLQLAQKNLQLQKVWQYTIISIATALVAFLTASLIYFYFRHKRKLHARQLHAVQQEKEIQVLQALMQGEEKERTRIAKDLHDGVAGMLAAAKMHVSTLQLQPEKGNTKSHSQAINLLNEASREVRKTAHNLMPEMLIQFGLDEALRRYCLSISNENVLVVQYDSWGDIPRYKDSFELSVYRIVQELLNNIIKHSQADHAIVQLSCQNHLLSATIEDNGIGFNQQESKNNGLGLRSLESRVQAINGKLAVETTTGIGVSAYLEFETKGLEVVSL